MTNQFVIFGAGPVGTTTARQLADQGTPVRVVTRSGSGPRHPGIELARGDLSDAESAVEATSGATHVVMAVNAPYTAAAWAEAFPRFQANAIAAASKHDAVLVTAENLYMYGPSETALRPDQPMRPTAAKGRIRARMADDLMTAHRRGEVRACTVRSADFLGPDVLESHVGERFVPRLLAGKRAQVIGNPSLPHTFSYVPDVARTIIAAATMPSALGSAWHTPCITTSIEELAAAVVAAAGLTGPAKVATVPSLVVRLAPISFLREIRELSYQFDRPFLVDASATEQELGVHTTALERRGRGDGCVVAGPTRRLRTGRDQP